MSDQESPFQKAEAIKPSKPPTTYKPSTSSNGDVDHGKRQHELQLNFKVKIVNKPTQKPVKLDPTTLQDKIAINEEAVMEDQAKMYEQASVSELKQLLKDRGLPTAGKKGDLVSRLVNPTNRQRITPLTLGDDRAASPTGSPKVKGGPASPRYSPYSSGSLSPRYQDHLSPRLVSNLSLNSPIEEDSDSSDGRRSEQGFFGTPLGRTSGALYAQSPDHLSPVEGRPRSQSIEPALPKGRARKVSADSTDLMMKKVMGRSSSTSVLPLRSKTRSEVSEAEASPTLPRAQSSEIYPTTGAALQNFQSLSYSSLDSIDETQLETASATFYQDSKRQYNLQVLASSNPSTFGQNSYGLLSQLPPSQDFAPHQLASYPGIADNQFLVDEEIPPADDLRVGMDYGGALYLSSPENQTAQSPSTYPMFHSHDPSTSDLQSGGGAVGGFDTPPAFTDDFYAEEPGYLLKKDGVVDFQLPSHGHSRYPGVQMGYNEFFVDPSQHSFDQRGTS